MKELYDNDSFAVLYNEPSYVYRVHCYRAVLEWLLVNSSMPEIHDERELLSVHSVTPTKTMTFEEYAKKALVKYPHVLEQVLQQVGADANAKEVLNSVDVEWSRRLVMLCLRLLFAPIVEHVVIADRMHFLRERGHRIHRVPLFEPKISP